VQGRWSLPFGSADSSSAVYSNPGGGVSVVYGSHLSWSELFTSGWGTSITAEVTVVRAGTSDGSYGRSKNNFSVGGYLSLLQNHLNGQRTSDGAGNSITADDLTMESYLVGATMYQNMGNNVYTEGRIGIGAVHYSAVNATYTSSFPFSQTFDGELFKDTWNFATELRGGVGYRMGPLGGIDRDWLPVDGAPARWERHQSEPGCADDLGHRPRRRGRLLTPPSPRGGALRGFFIPYVS
jgi:hypothetical protein